MPHRGKLKFEYFEFVRLNRQANIVVLLDALSSLRRINVYSCKQMHVRVQGCLLCRFGIGFSLSDFVYAPSSGLVRRAGKCMMSAMQPTTSTRLLRRLALLPSAAKAGKQHLMAA